MKKKVDTFINIEKLVINVGEFSVSHTQNLHHESENDEDECCCGSCTEDSLEENEEKTEEAKEEEMENIKKIINNARGDTGFSVGYVSTKDRYCSKYK